MTAPAMRILRVSLVDLELSPETVGDVWAQLTQQVYTTDGKIIGLAPVWKEMGSTGVVDFTTPANDDPGIIAAHRGFGVTIGWELVVRGAQGTKVAVSNPGTTYLVTLASPALASITSPTVAITGSTTPVPPVFTAASPPATATVGTPLSYTFAASGTPAPTFMRASGVLPSGVALSAGGTLAGTPTTPTGFTFTVAATNGADPDATTTHTIAVNQGATPPAFISAAPPPATVGMAYAYTFTATGSPTFAVTSGSLPAGLTLTAGVLAGTPTTAGTSTFLVTASNGITPNAATLCIVTVAAAYTPIVFTAAAPPIATVGAAYTYTFTATGSPTFTVASGGLPPGLTLTTGGVLAGTPTTAGTSYFTVAASNGIAPDASKACSVATASAHTAPTITAALPPGGTVGAAYSYLFAASGSTPITWAVTSGSVPAGLTLTTDGLLSGTPTTAATSTFVVTASNGTTPNAVSSTKTVTVAAAGGGGGGGGTPDQVLDFQTGDFSQWPHREFKDNATSADMARQQQIVTSPARPGFPYSARFDVIRTDQTSGDPGRNRSEVADYTDISGLHGGTTWWAWSMYAPTGFHVDTNAESPYSNGWLICTQWHSAGGSPPCDIQFSKPDDHIPHLKIESVGVEWNIGSAFPLGVWNDFRVGITFATGGAGHVTVKMASNGGAWATLVDADCTTLDSSGTAYFKQGIYRQASNQDQYLFFAGTRRGPTEASVTY